MKTGIDFTEVSTQIWLESIYQEGMTFGQMEEAVRQYISEQKIIHCNETAMNFLRDKDPSLQESLEIAESMGFSPKNLNVEILATLLHQSELQQEWEHIKDDVQDLIEGIN
jgi:hypothetical protein